MKTNILLTRAFFLILLLLGIREPVVSFQSQEFLEIGKSFIRKGEVETGSYPSFGLKMVKGQYAHLTLDQQGKDLSIEIYPPGGKKRIFFAGNLFGLEGVEEAHFIADEEGVFVVKITPSTPGSPSLVNKFILRLERLASPTATDTERYLIQKLIFDAFSYQLRSKYKESLNCLNEAGDRSQKLQDLKLEYEIAARKTNLLYQLGKVQDAEASATQALKIINKLNYFEPKVAIRLALAAIYSSDSNLQNWSKAEELVKESLELAKNCIDPVAVSAGINLQAGFTYTRQGRFYEAAKYSEEACQSFANMENQRYAESVARNNCGYARFKLGETDQALRLLLRSAELKSQVKDTPGILYTYNNLGQCYVRKGNVVKALEYFDKALEILKETQCGDQVGAGLTFGNIGNLYSQFDSAEKALLAYDHSLEYRKGQPEARNRILINIANILLRKDYNNPNNRERIIEKVESYFTQIDSSRIASPDQVGYSTTQANLQYWKGDYADALISYQEILNGLSDSDYHWKGIVLNRIGEIYLTEGKPGLAMANFKSAVDFLRKAGLPQHEATALYFQAKAEFSLRNLTDARTHVQQSIDLMNEVRKSIPARELKLDYLATSRDQYDLLIVILMELHKQSPTKEYVVQALQVAEQARVCLAADLLGDYPQAQLPANSSDQLKRAFDLQTKIDGKKRRLNEARLSKTDSTSSGLSLSDQTQIEADVITLGKELEQTRQTLSPAEQRILNPLQIKGLTVAQVQSQVLDTNTALVEYYLTSDRGWMWVVTQKNVLVFEVPKRAAIEALAEPVIKELQGDGGNLGRYIADFSRLGELMFPIEARAAVKGKRLFIVPDGILQAIPFAALPLNTAKSVSGYKSPVLGEAFQIMLRKYRPLLVEHVISNLPSASALAFFRSRAEEASVPPKTLAVIGAPIYTQLQPQSVSKENSLEQLATPKVATELESCLKGFRLDYNRSDVPPYLLKVDEIPAMKTQVQDLEKKYRPETIRIQDKATRQYLMGPEGQELLATHKIVHFVLHGLIDPGNPRKGGLLLSKFDDKGNEINGLFSPGDLYKVRFAPDPPMIPRPFNLDLVMFNACQTALGKDVSGIGIDGITYGFLMAGSRRVISTLWKTGPTIGVQFSNQYYQTLGGGRLDGPWNVTSSEGLRKTQLMFLQDGKKLDAQDLQYWASFVHYGDW